MQKKILVVDNSPVILKFMKAFLSKEGHDVRVAENGISALDVLKNFNPQIIFIDLVMPKITGDRLCRIIRAMPGMDKTFITILSGIAMEQKIDFLKFGANACIAKGPFEGVQKHISTLLDSLDRGEEASSYEKIIGGDSVFKRVVTEELLCTKNHFETTLDNMVEGFIELTTEGQIVYVNPSAMKLIGLPEEKILSTNFVNFFKNESADLLREGLAKLNDRPIFLGEQTPIILNGRYLSVTLVTTKSPNNHSIIIIIQDITDRKIVEQELARYRSKLEQLVEKRTAEITRKHEQLLQEVRERTAVEQENKKLESQLRQTHKMEALGTMAAGIAHDFNNILTGIVGFTELCRMDSSDKDSLNNNLDQVITAGNRAKDLIKQILTFSRQKEQEFAPTRIHIILKEALKLFRASAPSSIEIIEDIDKDSGLALVDSTQIHQVVMNLCTNAIHAMKGKKGTLKVSLTRTSKDSAPEGTSIPPRSFVTLSVSDTGKGMDAKIIEKIYDPYFTTKEPGEGTGMGLAVVHGIVSSHGSIIEVESEPDRGTTFSIFFPEVIMEEPEKKQANSAGLHGCGYILLVDDEQSIRQSSSKMLKSLGYKVREANCGEEALEVIKSQGELFDLVLTDVTMPGLSGFDLTTSILRINPNIPVIISTGNNMDRAQKQEILAELGAVDILFKPFSFPELAFAVKNAIDKSNQ